MYWLTPKDGPVMPGMEQHEVVYAKNQPQYQPLRTLIVDPGPQYRVMSRWTLTPEQRKAVAEGADIFLTVLTFRNPLQPVLIGIDNPEERLRLVETRTTGVDFGFGVKPKPYHFEGHVFGLPRPERKGMNHTASSYRVCERCGRSDISLQNEGWPKCK